MKNKQKSLVFWVRLSVWMFIAGFLGLRLLGLIPRLSIDSFFNAWFLVSFILIATAVPDKTKRTFSGKQTVPLQSQSTGTKQKPMRHILLRPAMAPNIDRETLLRPIGKSLIVEPQQLLRASTQEKGW